MLCPACLGPDDVTVAGALVEGDCEGTGAKTEGTDEASTRPDCIEEAVAFIVKIEEIDSEGGPNSSFSNEDPLDLLVLDLVLELVAGE